MQSFFTLYMYIEWFSSLTVEYFLEDAIEMLHFIPPPQDKKKKKPQGEREAYEMEADVSQLEIRNSLYTVNFRINTV